MRACFLLVGLIAVNAKKITKFIDVEGLKLFEEADGTVSESVQYKFKLNHRDKPEIQLLASKSWIPIKLTINGKNEVVTVMSKAPKRKWQRRGRATRIRYLNNINGQNELIISFNKNEWKISINGHDVSNRFGTQLKHNNAWKFVRRARAISGFPIRRFTVTKNKEIPAWKEVNHDLCGFNYQMPNDKQSYLNQHLPNVARQINLGMTDLAERCHNNRDGSASAESRIVGGRPSLPGFYPWMVALRLGNEKNAHNCGATLINRCWAVSAAHCFKDDQVKDEYVARVGDYFNRNVERNGVWEPLESVHESKLKTVIRHHEYDHSIYNNDIALIELEDCVPSFNNFRAPICLPTSTAQHGDGECCHIHGWGQLASSQEQLEKFIRIDNAKARADSSYEKLYPGLGSMIDPTQTSLL